MFNGRKLFDGKKVNEDLQTEYGFIQTNEHLGKHVILLGLTGSYSYGTNIETSDIDIRGITLNQKSDLIGLTQYEQYVDENTDTVIYAFNKIIPLLLSCNPNTIELLGLNPEHYLYLNDIGRMLLDNRKLFLSKRAINSFGGYADAQLRRLQNALARDTFPQSEKADGTFHESFYEMLSDFEKKLHYAAENTDLPDEPDIARVQELVMTINERVIRDEI